MKNITGIILCGGKGTRLNELGEKIPKCLLAVNKKPMIQYTLDSFASLGLKDIKLATGHLSEKIETYMSHANSGLNYQIINDGVDASMLQRMISCIPQEEGYSIVVYGDTFIDLDFNSLYESHKEWGSEITLLSGENTSPWGVLELNNNEVREFKEKPKFIYYIGGYICNNSIRELMLQELDSDADATGFVNLLQRLTSEKKVSSFLHKGFTTTFNTVVELQKSDEELKKYITLGNQ